MNCNDDDDYIRRNALALRAIAVFKDQLENLRTTTQKPEQLEWELRLYEYMEQDPVNRLKQYQGCTR